MARSTHRLRRALFAQNTQTGFGDSNLAQVSYATAPNRRGVRETGTRTSATVPQYLWVLITGNLESNFHR